MMSTWWGVLTLTYNAATPFSCTVLFKSSSTAFQPCWRLIYLYVSYRKQKVIFRKTKKLTSSSPVLHVGYGCLICGIICIEAGWYCIALVVELYGTDGVLWLWKMRRERENEKQKIGGSSLFWSIPPLRAIFLILIPSNNRRAI